MRHLGIQRASNEKVMLEYTLKNNYFHGCFLGNWRYKLLQSNFEFKSGKTIQTST